MKAGARLEGSGEHLLPYDQGIDRHVGDTTAPCLWWRTSTGETIVVPATEAIRFLLWNLVVSVDEDPDGTASDQRDVGTLPISMRRRGSLTYTSRRKCLSGARRSNRAHCLDPRARRCGGNGSSFIDCRLWPTRAHLSTNELPFRRVVDTHGCRHPHRTPRWTTYISRASNRQVVRRLILTSA